MDMTTAEARKNLSDVLNRVAYSRERVIVTRHGREIAAIVSLEDLGLIERLKGLLEEREVADALDELESGASVSWRTLREELRG